MIRNKQWLLKCSKVKCYSILFYTFSKAKITNVLNFTETIL